MPLKLQMPILRGRKRHPPPPHTHTHRHTPTPTHPHTHSHRHTHIDTHSSDSVHHKSITQLAVEPLDSLDDVEFTKEKILAVLEKFDPSKTPGKDGLNSDILLRIFRRFPIFFTEIYECLRKGYCNMLFNWMKAHVGME